MDDQGAATRRRVSLLRRLAWLAVAALGAAHLWLLWEDVRFWGLTRFPDPFMLGFILFLLLLAVLDLVGVWLLARAARVGGGRWLWRWWCGALLVYSPVAGLIDRLLRPPEEHEAVIYLTAYPDLGRWLFVAAIAPVAFLGWTAQSVRGAVAA